MRCCASRWRCCGPTERPAYRRTRWSTRRSTAARRRTPAAAAFVNAVLRRFLREREALVAAGAAVAGGAPGTTRPGGSSGCSATGPTQWQALLAAANQHPPMTLRVNAPPRQRCRLCASGWPRWACRPGCWTTRPSAARRWCWPSPARCSSCPALPTARCRCRTPRPSAPRRCCWATPACAPGARACSTPAPRPAARPRTCWSWPTWTCWRWTATPRAWPRVQRHAAPAAAAGRSCKAGDAAPAGRLVGRPALRRHPARRAVQRLGHRAPPPRHPLAAPRPTTSPRWPRIRPAAGRAVAAAQAGRPAALCHLLGLQGRGPGPDRRVFATPWRQRARRCTRPRPAICCRCPTIAADAVGPTQLLHDGFYLRPDRTNPDKPAATTRDAPADRSAEACCRAWRSCCCCWRCCWASAPVARPGRRAGVAATCSAQRRRADARLRRPRRPCPSAWKTPAARRAGVLRGRGHALPQPLVLARRARGARPAQLAPGLPAADVDLARQLGRLQPELRQPGRGAGRGVAQHALEAGRSVASSTPKRGTTSSSATGSTPPSCPARCRSAWAASPSGCWASSARCGWNDRVAHAGRSRRHEPQRALGLGRRCGGRDRRRAGAGLRAVAHRPSDGFYERHFVWLFWLNVAVARLLVLVIAWPRCGWWCACGAASSAAGC